MNNQNMPNRNMPNQGLPNQMPNQNMPNQGMPNQMPNQNMKMPDFSKIYPEIFYKIQPYIMMICDQMDTYYGDQTPNQEMLDQISENLYKIIIEMYPDLEEMARNNERKEGNETVSQVITRSPYFYGRGYRSRGLFRDLLDILFLSEFYGRRRRRRYY